MKRVLILISVFVLFTSTAYAGLVETFGIGVKETTLGKAVSANADSPFATFYNPAGLSLIDKPTITGGAIVYNAQVYSENFKLVATEDGSGGIYANVKKGDVINLGWDTDNETDNDPLVHPHLGFAMPLTDKFSFGIGAYAPYGFHIESDRNPYNNPLSFYAWESFFARKAVTPTIAYKLNDKLSFGFGISIGQSESNAGKTYAFNPFQAKLGKSIAENQALLNKTLGAIATQGQPEAALAQEIGSSAATIAHAAQASVGTDLATKSYKNQLKLESTDDVNYSWNAGVMYRPTKKISMGLTYRGRTEAKFEGDTIFAGTKIGSVTMHYDHPEQVQGGIRYAFSKNLSVEFDVTWTNWSINKEQVEEVDIDQEAMVAIFGNTIAAELVKLRGNAPALQKAVERAVVEQKLTLEEAKTIEKIINGSGGEAFSHPRNWDSTFQYQLGAEWLVNNKFSLRGGIIYDPTPVPDSTFDYGWPDTDRTVVNIGFGYKITESWEIDAILQHVFSTPKRDIRGESDQLNEEFSHIINATGGPDVEVHLDEDEGVLWGAGLSVTYKF